MFTTVPVRSHKALDRFDRRVNLLAVLTRFVEVLLFVLPLYVMYHYGVWAFIPTFIVFLILWKLLYAESVVRTTTKLAYRRSQLDERDRELAREQRTHTLLVNQD